VVQRSFDQPYLDRVTAYQATPAYKKAMRKRSVWIEPLFGEAKQWHQAAKFRLRRLRRVNIQALITAAGQNIKRLLKPQHAARPLPPAVAMALALPAQSPAVVVQPLRLSFFIFTTFVAYSGRFIMHPLLLFRALLNHSDRLKKMSTSFSPIF
jgi:hypothetical protein